MSMIVMWLKKTWLIAIVTALGFGSLPIANVFALGVLDPITPTPQAPLPTNRLERIWAREQKIYTRLGKFLNNYDSLKTKAQGLINKAKANGKDTSTLQAALDAFTDAVNQTEPIYQSAGGITSSHQGFDENGKVIDHDQALAMVKDLRSKFKGIHQLLVDPRKALRAAFKAYREAINP